MAATEHKFCIDLLNIGILIKKKGEKWDLNQGCIRPEKRHTKQTSECGHFAKPIGHFKNPLLTFLIGQKVKLYRLL
uniref:Uncharacterized protein n=1 Tax=Hyaloperonospora arabidopsidis (strain Emoy2) TaxID=559515 RepID=M4B2X0_HYAAE